MFPMAILHELSTLFLKSHSLSFRLEFDSLSDYTSIYCFWNEQYNSPIETIKYYTWATLYPLIVLLLPIKDIVL